MAQIDLRYYLLEGKVCTLALPIAVSLALMKIKKLSLQGRGCHTL